MINKSSVLLLVTLIFSIQLSAQNYIDVLKLDYLLSPSNAYKDTTGNTKLQELNVELTAPLKINDRSTFLTGCFYEQSTASFNPRRPTENVFGATLKLGVNHKHSEKWSGTYMFLPKLSSDLKQIGPNDFQFGGFALLQYSKSTHLNYRIGVYANGDKFGPFFVPLLGIYYLNATEKLEIKGVLPLSVDVNYLVAKNARFGLNFKGQVRSYNLNNAFGSEQTRYLVKSTNEVCAYFQYGFKNRLNFQAYFGRSLARSFRAFDERVNWAVPLYYNGDKRTQLNTDFSDGWLFKIGMIYRVNI